MHPILFDFGTRRLPLVGDTHLFLASYGLIFAAAVFGAWIVWRRLAVQAGIRPADAEAIGFGTLIAGLIGSKLTLILLDLPYYFEDPARILGTLRAAGVLMGGVAAALLAGAWLCRRRKIPFWTAADAAAVPLPFAQAVGRIGCLLAGCCWGLPAPGLPWAITFTNPSSAEYGGCPLGEPLHPVQIYQCAADLLVGLAVWMVWRRRRFSGQVMLSYLFLYGVERFIVEYWRGDTVRGIFLGGMLSTSQILSLVSAAIALLLWKPRSRRPLRTAS